MIKINGDEMNTRKNIILYDGECNLCSGLTGFIRRSDRKGVFGFIPLKSEQGKNMLSMLGIEAGGFDSVVYLKENNILFRSTAILAILRDLGGIWRLAYIFILVPEKARDFVYRLIARTRYVIFGKTASCHC